MRRLAAGAAVLAVLALSPVTAGAATAASTPVSTVSTPALAASTPVSPVSTPALAVSTPASAVSTPVSAVSTPVSGGPALSLMAQTPWIQTKGAFQLQLGITGAVAGDRLEILVFDQVRTRSAFERAASGKVEDYTFYAQAAPLSALAAGPSGGYEVDLPVQEAAPAGSPFGEVTISEQFGVFPVQAQLVDANGVALGAPLTTFLTYSANKAAAQGYSPLAVAVVVPYATTPAPGKGGALAPVGPTETTELDGLAAALNADDNVHASLLASPATLAGLQAAARTSSAARDALDNLGGAPAGGLIQVLPTPWSPVSLGDLVQAGLASEVDRQLGGADRTLEAVLGTSPSRQTWVVNGPVDQADLDAMVAQGAAGLIVPAGDLTAPPQITTTFANTSYLGSATPPISVAAADGGLSADFTRNVPPVLAANILLAELAMIFSEAPGETRVVVAMPPAGATVNPTLVSTLLAGLAGDPLVSAVTASGLFQAAGNPVSTRFLSDPFRSASPAAQSLAGARAAIITARSGINDLAAVLPSQSSQLSSVESELLLAESEALTSQQRAAVLAGVGRATEVVDHAVSLPPSTSITLTSTEGQIPITILTAGNLQPRIELKLKSQRLIFRPFRPPNGTCTVPTPTVETCVLSLKAQNTTLKVPVETRSSGVFPVDVGLYPPGSSQPLATDDDTVRSTAVSTVGIILIIAALGGLAFWWVRDIRRGRRPAGMLPPPDEAGTVDLDQAFDIVEDFFRRPPPSYRRSRMSPSQASAGPSQATDTYGSGREARQE